MDYSANITGEESMQRAANKILNAHASGDIVFVVGDCTVSYDGRGWKYLDEGKRSVVLKPTGALLVTSPEKVKPENWQPSGGNVTVSFDGDTALHISAVRENPDESLQIRFTNLEQSIHYTHTEDNASVEGTEKEIHEYIIDNPSEIEDGLRALEHEKETEFGDIDIYARDASGTHVILEVKRKTATLDSVSQLNRYMTVMGDSHRAILVAPSMTDSAEKLLNENQFQFCRLKPTEIL